MKPVRTQARFRRRPRHRHRPPTLVLLLPLVLSLVLSACGLPRPFQHQAYAPAGNPLAAPSGGVSVALPPLVGAPAPLAHRVAAALAEDLRARDVAAQAVAGAGVETPGLMLLGWTVAPDPPDPPDSPDTSDPSDSGPMPVSLRWTLVAPSGRIVGEAEHTVDVGRADWAEAAPAAVRALVQGAAPRLAKLLLPADVAGAAPGPESDLGQDLPLHRRAVMAKPSPAEAPRRADRAGAEPDPPAVAAAGRHPAAVDAIEDLVMAPPEITRAPGDGRAALADALTRLFRQNGVQIADRPRPDRLRVRGAVEVLPGEASDTQQVSIVWEVLDADGASLGKVNQANVIPRGLLDRPWGDTALLIAEGAAAGVGEILIRKGLVPAP